MTPKERAAMQQALEALRKAKIGLRDWELPENRYAALEAIAPAITALREALAEQAEQEPFDMNDHPPHRLCECRKCMEYFTPLPDCDAFAAFGKPIAEQTNTQLMEGYRIGLAEMREKCAKSVYDSTDWAHEERDMVLKEAIAAAIRAIKFEGDIGFRPVSEMIAEHKQDPKKAAAIEKAKMRKAEQKPVAVVEITYGREPECYVTGNIDDFPEGVFKLYTAPHPVSDSKQCVKEVELTDDEINELWLTHGQGQMMYMHERFARAVIAAHKEKNK